MTFNSRLPPSSYTAAMPSKSSTSHLQARSPSVASRQLPAYGNPNIFPNPPSHYFPSPPNRRPPTISSTEYARGGDDDDDEMDEEVVQVAGGRDDDDGEAEERGEAEEDVEEGGRARKRSRTITTAHQTAVLTALLNESRFPSTETRAQVGLDIGMSSRRVQIWFQNRRQSQKRALAIPANAAPASSRFQVSTVSPLTATVASAYNASNPHSQSVPRDPYSSSRYTHVPRAESIMSASSSGTRDSGRKEEGARRRASVDSIEGEMIGGMYLAGMYMPPMETSAAVVSRPGSKRSNHSSQSRRLPSLSSLFEVAPLKEGRPASTYSNSSTPSTREIRCPPSPASMGFARLRISSATPTPSSRSITSESTASLGGRMREADLALQSSISSPSSSREGSIRSVQSLPFPGRRLPPISHRASWESPAHRPESSQSNHSSTGTYRPSLPPISSLPAFSPPQRSYIGGTASDRSSVSSFDTLNSQWSSSQFRAGASASSHAGVRNSMSSRATSLGDEWDKGSTFSGESGSAGSGAGSGWYEGGKKGPWEYREVEEEDFEMH